jgi:hypothetical protein
MREEFRRHLKEELEKYNGISFPLKSSRLRRIAIISAKLERLHPNPDDEFCKPEVGPSDRIIGEYEKKFLESSAMGTTNKEEPLIVERMYPDGYMLANGHHRWAAYYSVKRKKAPIRIVNLTHEADLKEMVESAMHDKRVTLDLDEMVFGADENGKTEPKPPFPFQIFYKEDVKAGIPALFHYLWEEGYDIWLYSSKFYSIDYIWGLFSRYHVKVVGIVTGTSRNTDYSRRAKSTINKMISEKYTYTLHIDNDAVLRINSKTKEFEEYPLNKEKGLWKDQVREVFAEIKANEQEKEN